MTFDDILGMTITNIYSKYVLQDEWLDTVENFIELDRKTIIEIPFSASSIMDKCYEKQLDSEAKSLFTNLDNNSNDSFEINNEKSNLNVESKNIFEKTLNKIKKIFKITNLKVIKTLKSININDEENKLQYIRNKRIINFIWYSDSTEKGFFLLENGYLITEVYMSPHGTGHAGLHLFNSIDNLIERHGEGFNQLLN